MGLGSPAWTNPFRCQELPPTCRGCDVAVGGGTDRCPWCRVVTGRPLHFSSNNGKRTESRTLVIMGCGDVGRLNLRPTAQLEAFCLVQSWRRWIGVRLADSAQIDSLGVVRSDLRWRIGQCAARIESRLETQIGCPALSARSLHYREKPRAGEQNQAVPRRGLSPQRTFSVN